MTIGNNVILSQTVSWRNKYVFSLFLNTDSDEAEVTSLGRPFYTFAAAPSRTSGPYLTV